MMGFFVQIGRFESAIEFAAFGPFSITVCLFKFNSIQAYY